MREEKSVFRIGWTDASPLGGYDWLWSQCHECRDDDAIPVMQAVTKLYWAIKEHLDDLEAEATGNGDLPDIDSDGDALDVLVPVDPLPEWLPHNRTIDEAIFELIHPPAALGSGA
eukprot:7964840-Karenia_brevis.AAC.1